VLAASRSANCLAALLALSAVLVPLRARAQTETPTQTPRPTRTATPEATQTPVIIVATPTPGGEEDTPEVTPTPEFSAARPAINGGIAVLVSESDSFGLSGETVDAGDFEVRNATNLVETITEVVIQATDQDVVSSFTLTGRGGRDQQTVSVTPSGDNWFLFAPGLTIEPGETASFSLSATIAAANAAAGTATPESVDTSTPTPTPTELIFGQKRGGRGMVIASGMLPAEHGSFPFGALALGVVLVGMASALRGDRRAMIAAASLLALVGIVWLSGITGCAGDEESLKTVTRITGRTRTNPVRFTGVPISIGRVARPLALVFPGHVDSIDGTATPSF
jgi:hypothetical protein